MTREERLIALVTEAVAKLNSRVVLLESAPQVIERTVEPITPPLETVRAFVEDYIRANPPEAGKDGSDASYEDIERAVAAFITANPPKNGIDGKDGENGDNGVSVTNAEIINGELELSFSDGSRLAVGRVVGRDGEDGINGRDGADGKDGIDGRDGADGVDGRGITDVNINDDGHLIVEFTDGQSKDVGRVTGDDGADGAVLIKRRTTVEQGGGGGTDRQEVFIGSAPTGLLYPALAFVSRVIGGQQVYEMQVNVP